VSRLSDNSIQAIFRRLRDIPRQSRSGTHPGPPNRRGAFFARITAVNADGLHSWKRVRLDDGAEDKFGDWPAPGAEGTENAISMTGAPAAEGDLVRLYLLGQVSGLPRYGFLPPGSSAIRAKITSSTSIGDNRWSYAFEAVKYDKLGAWTTIVDGLTGAAYNSIESNNDDAGVQGNGVDLANLPTGVTLVPIGVGAIVELSAVTNCETGAVEYVFQAVNQVDGACES